MKKLLFLFLLLTTNCFADYINPAPLNIITSDTSVSVYPYKLIVNNGTLTDNGDGTASLTTGGGSGTGGGGGGVTSVSGTAPITSTGGTAPLIGLNYDSATLSINSGNLAVKSGVYQASGTYVTLVSGTTPIQVTSGTSPSISILQSGTNSSGYLSQTDWNIFNNKQPSGSYITGNQNITLTGDASGTGTTSIPVTLATVNSNTGTYNNLTVNAQGLVTSASNISYQPLGTYVTSVSGTKPITITTGTKPSISLSLGGSLAVVSNNLTLSGDSTAPGNSFLYGTNSGGTKGWYVQPTSMTYPGVGIANSTGSAWGTSYLAPSGTIVGNTDTITLTNKYVTPRITTVTSNTNWTINSDSFDIAAQTALSSGTCVINNPSGTPTDGQKLVVRLLDSGTARGLTWGNKFVSRGATLPTTTVISKLLYIGFFWDANKSTWDCVATAQE